MLGKSKGGEEIKQEFELSQIHTRK